MYFFSSNNNYVIQKYALSPEGMFANTRFSREQCWQTLLFVLRENVCKYLTQTIAHCHPLAPSILAWWDILASLASPPPLPLLITESDTSGKSNVDLSCLLSPYSYLWLKLSRFK
jgi:hypothetical protein